MIDLVTTFNVELFNSYSKNLLDTFLEKSDDSVRLNIFMREILMKLKNIIFHGIIKLGFINLFLMIGTFFIKSLVI